MEEKIKLKFAAFPIQSYSTVIKQLVVDASKNQYALKKDHYSMQRHLKKDVSISFISTLYSVKKWKIFLDILTYDIPCSFIIKLPLTFFFLFLFLFQRTDYLR